MRSADEILFRGRQEATNLYLLVSQPSVSRAVAIRQGLPAGATVAAALRGSPYHQSLEELAEEIRGGRLAVFGEVIEVGEGVEWRRDYVHDRTSSLAYFRRIPYLDFGSVGDHKYIWEVNRQQHLVLLAQAQTLRRDARNLRRISRDLESWTAQNPFQRGMNWASALEVAFRALSFLWVYHLVGDQLPDGIRKLLVNQLYRHARHLAANLSVYFSPNTHLLGEAVALYTIAALFPEFRGAAAWLETCQGIIAGQLSFQVRADGSHFEQSTYYHVYALDFFLFYYLMAGRPASIEPVLRQMAEYLHWLLGPNRRIFLLGDDDGGRLFSPYGKRREFGRATLATCGVLFDHDEWLGTGDDLAQQAAWWLGPAALHNARRQPATPSGSRYFTDAGAVFLQSEKLFAHVDCGPFGYGGAGHSHSDTLSVCLADSQEDWLIDPGTYTYVGDPVQRERFRGSGAHNTLQVDRRDQATAAGPFRWADKPAVRLEDWQESATGGRLTALCSYFGFTHRRRLMLDDDLVVVIDDMAGPGNEHESTQQWHLGDGRRDITIRSTGTVREHAAAHSPVYGSLREGVRRSVRTGGKLPHRTITAVGKGNFEIDLEDAAEKLR